MTIDAGGASSTGLVARVKGILLTPRTEWEVIDAEPATIKSLYLQYAVILAAIPAVCSFIGGQLVGVGFMGVHYKPPLIGGLASATLLDALITPVLFLMFGRKPLMRLMQRQSEEHLAGDAASHSY